jgi:hypothetical protein
VTPADGPGVDTSTDVNLDSSDSRPVTPSFDGDAVATTPDGGSGGSLDKVGGLDASHGSEPADTEIDIEILTAPTGAVGSVTLTYSTDGFGSSVPVDCASGGTSGPDDAWTASIPAQPQGTTVRFYVEATTTEGVNMYLPGNNVNYTYVTQ